MKRSSYLFDGHSFNEKYGKKVFIKLTNREENHHGYHFKTGLNIDNLPFNPSTECQLGGIYFSSLEYLSLWLNYGNPSMFYVRIVTVPNNSIVCVGENKFKANQLILGNRQKIDDLEVWKDNIYCLAAVQQNSYALKYVK